MRAPRGSFSRTARTTVPPGSRLAGEGRLLNCICRICRPATAGTDYRLPVVAMPGRYGLFGILERENHPACGRWDWPDELAATAAIGGRVVRERVSQVPMRQ